MTFATQAPFPQRVRIRTIGRFLAVFVAIGWRTGTRSDRSSCNRDCNQTLGDLFRPRIPLDRRHRRQIRNCPGLDVQAQAWQTVGEGTLPVHGEPRVGITSGGAPEGAERYARFRDFRILELTKASEMIDQAGKRGTM